jgi:hypothetical protein
MDQPRRRAGTGAQTQRLRQRRAGATARRTDDVERRRAAARRQAMITAWLRSLDRAARM